MQINSSQNASALYGANQVSPQPQPEKLATGTPSGKAENALTVAISPEAQALQKAAESGKAEGTQKADNERAMLQQQAQQQLQSQRPAAKSQRIDITV